ncbi:protein of unknown function [Legionella fallonii LLAP-10]|uniref:Uncharacterized protein n=1 Tax=Legionella fallonii LLAP-10 TaxID=1212491 RepID=A0A098G6I0_9GAMM|nr:protein of unknown function [Legionella fallonii LLAP-10]
MNRMSGSFAKEILSKNILTSDYSVLHQGYFELNECIYCTITIIYRYKKLFNNVFFCYNVINI